MKIKKVYSDDAPFDFATQSAIEFTDGTVLFDHHEQDCCESVFADFSHIDSEAFDYDFEDIRLESRRDGFTFGDRRRKFFVPCYNEQNGYYNDRLDILYVEPLKTVTKRKNQTKAPKVTFKIKRVITSIMNARTKDNIC